MLLSSIFSRLIIKGAKISNLLKLLYMNELDITLPFHAPQRWEAVIKCLIYKNISKLGVHELYFSSRCCWTSPPIGSEVRPSNKKRKKNSNVLSYFEISRFL